MNLESDKRLNIQLRLDFSSAPTGEARQAGREDIESLSVVNETERPANTSRILEEVCERANLKEALRQVKGQTAQADRQLYGVMGNPRAAIASSGGGEGGSAGDILRSSASQGSLSGAVLNQQGLITEAGFTEQADSFRSLQTVAGYASQEDELAAQGQDIAAQSYTDAAAADNKAATGKDISAVISSVAGLASLFIGIPP
jgi:hypothetical protein